MSVPIVSKVASALGNPTALSPLFVKDFGTNIGAGAFAYNAGGKVEAKDRLLDEFGTMALWLGGIPFFKKVIDLTLFKAKKIDSNIDIRVLRDESHKKVAMKYADESVKPALENANKNIGTLKKLVATRFGVATGATIAAYLGLTYLRHKMTEKTVTDEFHQKMKSKKFGQELIKKQSSLAFKSFNKSGAPKEQNPQIAFKGGQSAITRTLEGFMFNPAQNTMIIDGVITGGRVGTARDKEEKLFFIGKEAGVLFFMYAAGQLIQKGLEKASEKFLKLPIGLNPIALDSKELKATMQSPKKLAKQLNAFKELKSQEQILEFLHKNPDNIITKMAKKVGVIATHKNSDKIDVRHFIQVEEKNGFMATDSIKKIASDIEKLSTAAKGKDIQKFVNSARNAKVASIAMSIGACVVSLGVLLPYSLYKMRENRTGKQDFTVANTIEQKLALQYK